ncbi:MAG TPA: transposase [Terriglobia bacterium]|nr:transposase [Terriglobia bacterium]
MLCLGRHTVTGLLTTCGWQFRDWTSSYRLFSQSRLPLAHLFAVVRRAVVSELPPDAPVCAVLDDTLVRRAGLRTPGVAWRRDPLGPHFQTNFVRAQRFLQTSLVLPSSRGDRRVVPIAFRHAPTPPKPGKKAPAAEQAKYRVAVRTARLGQRAVEQIRELRTALDADPASATRGLLVAFDGGYTNQTVLKHLPHHTTAIGRIRQDAKLLFLPDPATRKARGRRLRYGSPAPTPEQVRTDDSPWQTFTFLHGGATHQLRFKRRTGLMWRAAGVSQILQLVVIAPLGYRLRKGSKLLYHQPAFLLCTDPYLDPQRLIETYLQRWGIEVNFREEKTLLGVGQAQVRSAASVESAPAFSVAAYAFLLLATPRAGRDPSLGLLPRPKWSQPSSPSHLSTQQALQQLRAEVWSRGLGLEHFSGFVPAPTPTTKPQKCSFPLASAVCYANA